jgi:hypothetical protein
LEEHDRFGKPVSTPDRARGGLFQVTPQPAGLGANRLLDEDGIVALPGGHRLAARKGGRGAAIENACARIIHRLETSLLARPVRKYDCGSSSGRLQPRGRPEIR